jgi:hypothetical protein
MLSSSYRSPWVYDPSGADLKDPDIWEVVRNQTDILAEILRRNNNIVRPWRVAPNYHASFNAKDRKQLDDSKRLAAIAHEGLSYCGNLDEARLLLCEDFFVGRKYGLTLWEQVYCSLDGAPEMLWFLPKQIKDVDRRRIHFVPDWEWVYSDGRTEDAGSEIDYGNGRVVAGMKNIKGGYLRKKDIHLEMFDTNAYQWTRISDEQRRNLIETVFYDEEDRVNFGRGTIEAIYFTHFFLTNTFQKLAEGIDRYANGVLIGKIDSLRNASGTKTNEDVKSAMMNVLNTYRSQHYIVLQEGDSVELAEPTGTGMTVAAKFIDQLVASVARLCNGSARPAGHSVDGTGSKAAASEEGDTSEAFYQNDRNRLDHALDRDLLGAFLYHNQDNLRILGLDRAKRPKFTSEQIKRQSPKEAAEVMQMVLAAGQPILKTQYYEKVELTPPSPDDEVVEGQVAQGPSDPFGGIFGGNGGAPSKPAGPGKPAPAEGGKPDPKKDRPE